MSVFKLRSVAALTVLSVLVGCSSTSDGEGGILAAALRGGPDERTGEETQAVVQGACPQVTLRQGTAVYRTYEGGEEDPSSVVHQASIADITRQCTLSGGEIIISVAAAGRVAAGPAGGAGAVQMPIRVVAVRGDEVLYSELTQYGTELQAGNPTGQFLFNDPDVRIPADAADDVRLYVGFDEGPYDTP